MSRQLHKYNLKVLGYEFVGGLGRDCLENIVQNDMRRYPLFDPVNMIIRTNQGSLHIVTAPGFVFDGRSGPKIVDWYAPNLGTLEERICWLVHDGNGYGQGGSNGTKASGNEMNEELYDNTANIGQDTATGAVVNGVELEDATQALVNSGTVIIAGNLLHFKVVKCIMIFFTS